MDLAPLASTLNAMLSGLPFAIGRIWADGKPLDLTNVTRLWYPGDKTQATDPFIAAKMSAANRPA